MDSEKRCTWCVTVSARDVVVTGGTELYAARRDAQAKRTAKGRRRSAAREIRNAIEEKNFAVSLRQQDMHQASTGFPHALPGCVAKRRTSALRSWHRNP